MCYTHTDAEERYGTIDSIVVCLFILLTIFHKHKHLLNYAEYIRATLGLACFS